MRSLVARPALFPLLAALLVVPACASSRPAPSAVAYTYGRVAEVSNTSTVQVDIYSSSSTSASTLLGTARPGETVRVTLPAGHAGVSCRVSSARTDRTAARRASCRVNYLPASTGS